MRERASEKEISKNSKYRVLQKFKQLNKETLFLEIIPEFALGR